MDTGAACPGSSNFLLRFPLRDRRGGRTEHNGNDQSRQVPAIRTTTRLSATEKLGLTRHDYSSTLDSGWSPRNMLQSETTAIDLGLHGPSLQHQHYAASYYHAPLASRTPSNLASDKINRRRYGLVRHQRALGILHAVSRYPRLHCLRTELTAVGWAYLNW